MAKISWSKALKDYLSDDTASYGSIALKYNVSKRAVTDRAVKEGWQDLRTKTSSKLHQKLPDSIGESLASIKMRHAKLGRIMQAKGISAIQQGENPRNFREAAASIQAGIRIEREALDMDEKQIRDEIYSKFSQFSFIFTLTQEELARFIEVLDNHRSKDEPKHVYLQS